MGNPLDTISGTITAGFVLTVVLYGSGQNAGMTTLHFPTFI